MAQKLKKASLMFGQAGQEPAKPTLSGFYGGVGAGQTGAIRDVTKGVEEETKKLPGAFGIAYDDAGKAAFTPGTAEAPSVFKPSVTLPAPAAAPTAPPTFKTSEEAAKAAEAAGKKVEDLETERKEKETELGKSTETALTKAGEVSTEQQKKLTEGKLGERREASELEKQAADYRNVLTGTPATSNIGAVANLMKFYDMSKYGALESGLRQGETALARQEAGATQAAMETAEGARAGAVEGFKTGAQQAYEQAQKLIGEEKTSQLGKIGEYYKGAKEAAGAEKATAETEQKRLAGEEETKAKTEFDTLSNEIVKNPAANVGNILKSISGRSGDNWLNTQGNKVLGPIKAEVDALTDRANQIIASTVIPREEKTAQLNVIKKQMNEYKGKIAGELAAFLGDTNTSADDALDAAEQIMAAGLIDTLSDEQKNIIKSRIEKDVYNRGDQGTIDKLMKIYKAFGGKYGFDTLSAMKSQQTGRRQNQPYYET